MRILVITAIAVALLSTGCKAASEVAPQRPSNAVSANTKPGDPLSALDKDGTAKSSFPKGAVERLNAIMIRSKNTIDRFDKAIPAIREANKAGTGAAGLAELEKLHSDAKSANADLIAEGKKLDASGQYYDVVIFGGMTLFAGKVEKELEEEIKLLRGGAK